MKDYFQRIRCHDRFNRLDASNKLVRQRAKKELQKEIKKNGN